VIWALYLLLTAGAFVGCGLRLRLWLDTRAAGKPRPGSHEDLP
jgi:hypothetical protein